MDRKATREGIEVGLGIIIIIGVVWFVMERIANNLDVDFYRSVRPITPYVMIPAGVALILLFLTYVKSRRNPRR